MAGPLLPWHPHLGLQHVQCCRFACAKPGLLYCGSSFVLSSWSCVMHSLVSNPFSCMDLYSDSVFYSFWLHFLSGLWTWLIILPCLGLSGRPVTTPALPKCYGTAPWLVRALPFLSCGQPQLIHPHGVALPMLSLPQVRQDLQIPTLVRLQSILLWWLFHFRWGMTPHHPFASSLNRHSGLINLYLSLPPWSLGTL